MKRLSFCRGFTLLELIVSTAVIFIILGVGLPAFSNVIENSKRKDTVYDLLGMLNFARDTAVSSSSDVLICPSSNGTSCDSSRDWSTTLLLFIDTNKNQQLDENEDVLRSFDHTDDKQSLSWRSFQNKPWLSFHANGSTGFQSGRIYYCYDGGEELDDRAQVIVYRTGRSRIAAPEEFKSGCG